MKVITPHRTDLTVDKEGKFSFRVIAFLELLSRKLNELLGMDGYLLQVSKGAIVGETAVNKFGEANDCDSGVDTDIWDGADGVTSTDIWVAPTVARIHDLASASANDAAAGTGMRTCKVCGLTDWDTKEVSETITLNGVTNVPTTNSYVIIHRIIGLTFGSGGTNAGIITCTAQTDATVTAAIEIGEGQTEMCIYGIPSTQKFYFTFMRADILKAGGGGTVKADMRILVKENADQSTAGFITKEKHEFSDSLPLLRPYGVPKKITGPAIIKLQVNTNLDNSVVSAVFDGVLVDN